MDVHYNELEHTAKAVGVLFNWKDKEPKEVVIEIIQGVLPYMSGQFYKRELPCIKKVIEQVNLSDIDIIEWFLREKWSLGNKFDIELESVLFTCPSCQRHLMMLVEYGRKNGKTINIKFYSHPKVFTLGDVKNNVN
ncbi:hypothetical protein P8625_13620 [Tenacibaculum tangerinum]|uniref:Uncharacterized protein n=1 Tax=Tenacibaculum tangerinum TaxID=3038772 RepID=A0ABY8LAD6_9FLAO|nr:hypothetical protein [Tenacibaculum tangerinum]WGH77114.1 hypothetical protein P8625_13620 [Tenacibaculum tangerinum]